MPPIYLDYNATTPLDPAVVEAMLPYLREHFGNPSSTHAYGKPAHDAVEQARRRSPSCSAPSPTRSSSPAAAPRRAIRRSRAPSSPAAAALRPPAPEVAHHHQRRRASGDAAAVRVPRAARLHGHDPARRSPRPRRSRRVYAAPWPSRHARSSASCTPTTRSARCSRSARSRRWPTSAGVLVHTDAAQSLGKVAVDVNELGVDLLTRRGAQAVRAQGRRRAVRPRRGVKLEPLIHGAGHEGGRRAGTENVPYIVGLGTACEIARQTLPAATTRLRALRDRALAAAARGARRARRAQRPSGMAAAEHAQRQLRRPRRRRAAGDGARRSRPRPARRATKARSSLSPVLLRWACRRRSARARCG